MLKAEGLEYELHGEGEPVLYLLGSESGPRFERPRQLFVSSVPQTEEVVLPGLNHLLQMRDPSLVAVPIADFLARHPISGTARCN